ncbi:MAG: CHASE2 domain-containing protein, partial [Deltaproteobacteria bacterium]|nr:CHASE2 domain-containing protein [Deltaproteobacteria bacterium]
MPLKRTLLTAIPFLILLLASLFHFPALRWLEQKSIDWRFEWRGARPTTGEIVVVAIDEKSLNQEGRWPWPRKKIAQLIKKMNEAGPSLIEMDLVFAEPDPDDKILVQALSEKKNTILGYFFYRTQKELQGADISTDEMEKNYKRILSTALPEMTGLSQRLHPMSGLVVNTESIAHSALTQGYFNA